MAVKPEQLVRDIRRVARAVDQLWDRDAAPSGIRADADTIRRIVDEAALIRIVNFLIDRDDHSPAHRAAQRLDSVLRTITSKQKADIQNGLRERSA